jgi:hypothetical protein
MQLLFYKRTFLIILIITISFAINAQPGHRTDIHPDSISKRLWMDLDKGYFEFHKRSFAMSTINEGGLHDYFTVAAGAGLGYYSPSFHNFHLGFSGFFVFQLYQHNLHVDDPNTGKGSRYEHQLYDLNHVKNSNDLDRLEEFYITYERKNLKFELGRQKVESPLLNENDNRMRPNIFSGLTAKYKTEHLKLLAGWFIAETIRGTIHWYKIDHTFGIYNQGRNPLGDTMTYKGNITTNGIGVLGAEYEKNHWELQAWNYTSENVFNLTFAQVDYELELEKTSLHFGAQGLYQYALNNGGNTNPSLSYILPDEQAFAIGSRFGITYNAHELTMNYFGISDQGRYLFPREWGREKFYASLTREIFEGYGGLNAYVLKYKFNPSEKNYWLSLGAGYIDQPNINNVRLNKYGLDDYYHFTGTFDYKFKGYLEGLDIKCVVIYKKEANEGSMNYREKMNKVDMINLNLIVDYRF